MSDSKPSADISVEIGRRVVRFRSVDGSRSAEALLGSLPLEAVVTHSIWSGEAVEVRISGAATLAQVGDLEAPVSSIYPGCIALRWPANEVGQVDLLIAYGTAESRGSTGREFVTVVAELVDDRNLLVDMLRAIRGTGEQPVQVRRPVISGGPASPTS